MSNSHLCQSYRVTRPQDFVWRDVDGEVVILDVSSGAYYSGNAVATLIWDLLILGEPVDAIVAAVADRCQVPVAEVAHDVREFVDELQRREIIQPAEIASL